MSHRKIIESLLDIFLPSDVTPEIKLLPDSKAYTHKIGDKEIPCVLGVNARLQ